MDTTEIRCPTCQRLERWTNDARVVELEGGVRRPPEHPELAAWRLHQRSRSGSLGPIVARCPACDLPMTAPAGSPLPAIDWTFQLPDGPVTVAAGDAPPADLGARLTTAWTPVHKPEPLLWLFQGTLLSISMLPILLWLWAVSFTFWFLLHYYR